MTTRVLHIVGRMDRAGAETMLMNYYRSIDRDRLQFDFLVYTDDVCDYDAEIESLGGRIIRISEHANWLSRTASIFRTLRAGNWSAVHSHTNFSSIFPLFAAFLAGIPVRVAHAHATEIETSSLAKNTYQSLAPPLIRGLATHKVACGERAAGLLFAASDRVSILPNAVEAPAFMLDRRAASEEIRAELDIRSGTRILLQVARLDPVKNQLFLVEVAAALKRRGHDFVMLLAGRGELEPAILDAVERAGLQHWVRLLGVRSDVPRLLNAADAFVLPSFFEGFPVVLVEAQAAGLPCIVSDRVSDEVDLGMGLVSFRAIPGSLAATDAEQMIEEWAAALAALHAQAPPSQEQRHAVLKAKGYCTSDAMNRLGALYGIK